MQTNGIPDHLAPKEPSMALARVRKSVTAACGLAATLVAAGALDGKAEAIVSGLLAIATAYGVYQVRNEPAGPTV